MKPFIPIFKQARVATSAALSSSNIRVFAVLLSGPSAASTLKLTNDANGSGNPVLHFSVLNGDSQFFDFTNLGGVEFTDKCYATIAGSGAEAQVWYM